ncbi:MAG: DUF2975 domain-containing protein [Oscillospiraceae bacterium]|nr:DUF2975 domain-containing protein [Oscillospiraceae bacterium]
MKTATQKMKETAVAAAVVSSILALLSLITAISQLAEALGASSTDAAASFGNTTDGVLTCCMMVISAVMFADMAKSATPFTQKSVFFMRGIAAILMLSSVAAPLTRMLALSLMGEAVSGFSTNRGMLFLGAIMLLLVQIFSYGRLLQQESDETL